MSPLSVLRRVTGDSPDLTWPGSGADSGTMSELTIVQPAAGQPTRNDALSNKRRPVHKKVYSDPDLSYKVGTNIK